MIYLKLFCEFFKTGLFAVGGGLATLPFLSDMADRTGWFTQAQLADMLAVSESTPGPVGVNMATYVGFETAGVLGAVVATLGLVTPSVIVILIATVFAKVLMAIMYICFNKKAGSPVLKAMVLDSFLDCATTTFALMGLFLITKINFAAYGVFAIIIGTAVTVSAEKNIIEQGRYLINN